MFFFHVDIEQVCYEHLCFLLMPLCAKLLQVGRGIVRVVPVFDLRCSSKKGGFLCI